MPPPPRQPAPDVLLRLSPTKPSAEGARASKSFSRMSTGRTSVAAYRSEARAFLDRYAPDSEHDPGDTGVGDVTYDPADPWSSPRGAPRPSSPQCPARNFKPGLSALAARVRQREVFCPPGGYGIGKKTMLGLDASSEGQDGHEGFFFEIPDPKTTGKPDRVMDLVKVAQMAAPEFVPHPRRKRRNLRAAKLPELKPTPRLERKLQIMLDTAIEEKEPRKREGRRSRNGASVVLSD